MLDAKIKTCQNLLEKCDKNKSSEYVISRLFELQLNQLVRSNFVDKFWSHLPPGVNKCHPQAYKPMIEAVKFLAQSNKHIDGITSNNYFKRKFSITLKSQILAHKPHYLKDYLDATYFRALRAFLSIEDAKIKESKAHEEVPMQVDGGDTFCEDEEEISDDYADIDNQTDQINEKLDRCPGCSCGRDTCRCEQICAEFDDMNKTLRQFELLDGLVENTVITIARVLIERRVSAKCKSSYSCSHLYKLTDWVHDTIKRWMISIHNIQDPRELDLVRSKLDQHLKDAYAEVRVAHMFEIIIEYPNSEAAIQDLKLCLDESTSSIFRLNLIETVKQSLIESLLHPGVNTYDILTAYISAIKALRSLDPTGLILQLVTEPIRRYLKSRDDTVRCIVTALTDEENNSELNREMISGTQTNENGVFEKNGNIEMTLPNEGEKCTATNFEKWKPDPIKLSSSDDVMKSSRFSDIVSILVNIYETKDLFVEEYQKLLSQRLLNKYDECNLDTELRNLELLTLRFSDCELHRCEVMLKDVQTSKRINKRILSGDIHNHKLEGFKELDVLIVSSPFWPEKFSPIASISDETPNVEFPEEIEKAIGNYTKAFEAIQASRTLHWRHHLGSVNMDIIVGDRVQNFTVSPLHASLLYLFKEKKSWRLSEIIHKSSLPAATIKSRLALWQRNGLIRDCGEDRELECMR